LCLVIKLESWEAGRGHVAISLCDLNAIPCSCFNLICIF